MTKYILDRPGGWDYPELGFYAAHGAILDATAAPDPYWALAPNQALPETVARYPIGGTRDSGSFVGVADGDALIFDSRLNAYVPRPAAALGIRVGAVDAFGHSYTEQGIASGSQDLLWWALLARGLGAIPRKFGKSGARLSNGLATHGGWATIRRNTPGTLTPLDNDFFPPMPGAVAVTIGFNDCGAAATYNGTRTTQARASWRHSLRAAMSDLQCAAAWEANDPAGPVALDGSWSTFASTQYNSGNGYSQTTSAGATLTVTTPSAFPGGVLALSFVTSPAHNADQVPSGPVTFTLDAGPVVPLGYSSFDTKAANYTELDESGAHGYDGPGTMVARFQVPAGAHTIVASHATGMAVDRLVVEATKPRPVLWADIATTVIMSTGQEAAIPQFNADLASVAAEFPTDAVKIVPMAAALGTDPAHYNDGIHPNELGHALIVDAMRATLTRFPTNLGAWRSAGGRYVSLVNGVEPDASGAITIGDTVTLRAAAPVDVTRTNTTSRSQDPDLYLDVTPGTWTLDAVVAFNSSTAADVSVGFACPPGTAGHWFGLASIATNALFAGLGGGQIALSAMNLAGLGAGADSGLIVRSGLITVTQAGRLALTWAQASAEATNTIRRAGGRLELRKVA